MNYIVLEEQIHQRDRIEIRLQLIWRENRNKTSGKQVNIRENSGVLTKVTTSKGYPGLGPNTKFIGIFT